MATTSDKQYDNTNRGTLFPNERKTTDKHPDYTGSINIEGVDYWISGWGKVAAASGKKFVSLSVTKKEATVAPAGDVLGMGGSTPKPAAQKPVSDDLDDDVPF